VPFVRANDANDTAPAHNLAVLAQLFN